jgi:hypothetical protein
MIEVKTLKVKHLGTAETNIVKLLGLFCLEALDPKLFWSEMRSQ